MNDRLKNAQLRIKQAWDENPLAVIAVGALAVTAAAKLMDANTNRVNAHAWKKEVDRRERTSRNYK